MPSHSKVVVFAVILVCGISLAVGGCADNKVHAAAPVASAPVAPQPRPMTVAPDTDATPPLETAAQPPTPPPNTVPPPLPVAATPAKPSPPHRVPEQATSEASSSEPSHPQAPQISPQLSPGDQASYERRTNDDVSAAEKNLEQTNGRQLSAAQQDLTAKIRSFLSQSREASKDGDWARAQNLSQKARLLSVELINSL
jgi:hypothetical protein